jgi:aldose 1-epimerase
MSTAPDELILRSESLEVVLLPELGGRVHRIRALGHDLLRTPPDPRIHAADPFFWGAYPMAPWCNRAPAGPQTIAGSEVWLHPNFPDGSAIHGLVHDAPWMLGADGVLSIRAGGGGEPWPWAFEVRLVPAVEGDAMSLGYRLANRSDAPMPAGLGLHPWFRRPLRVEVPAERVYRTNAGSPAEPEGATGPFDLMHLAEPASGLDGTWAGPSAGRIRLDWPDAGVAATLAISSGVEPLVAIASPETIDAIAIEPQTHGPDPFRRLDRGQPDAPILLDPGAELRLDLRLTVGRARNLQ